MHEVTKCNEPHVMWYKHWTNFCFCGVFLKDRVLFSVTQYIPIINTPFTQGHGNPVSGHRRRTSAKWDWRETTQGDGMLKRDCRGCFAKILNCQKFDHGSHSADEDRSKTGWTQQNVTASNRS